MFKNLLKNVNMLFGLAAVSNANNTDSNTSRFDMKGYDGILFVTSIADSAATGVATLTVEGNTIDSDSGMAAITGAAATKTCTTNDDINSTLLVVDVYRPQKRYIQGVLTSSAANIAFGTTYAIQYKGKGHPVVQGTTVSASTQVAG